VLHAAARVGRAVGEASLKEVLAQDGARVRATVADKDNNLVADPIVIVAPADVRSEAEWGTIMTGGYADQNGVWTSGLLAPGKYLVMATLSSADYGRDSVVRLWRLRSKMKEVDIAPGATASVTLAPIPVE